jgi:hypothetical protein
MSRKSPDAKQADARRLVITAMLELQEVGYAGKPVENNPVQRLQNEVWPLWHLANYGPLPDATASSRSDRLRQREAARNAASDALAFWARQCWLMVPVERSEPGPDFSYLDDALAGSGELQFASAVEVPAGWIIAEAEELCASWSAEFIGPHPRWWQAVKVVENVPVQQPFAPRSTLTFSMKDPCRQPSESRRQFDRRARRALNEHLAMLDETSGASVPAPEPIAGSRPPAKLRRKLKALDHYLWLVLYQCCGWSLKRIGTVPYQVTENGIWKGAAEAAAAAGLKLRTKR